MNFSGSSYVSTVYGFPEMSENATCTLDFCVAGFNLGRFGSRQRGYSGGHGEGGTDPTYTRGLSLAFSPQVTSQPFRTQPGALPGPWGNVNCLYSMTIRQEPTSYNQDLNGQARLYRPSYGGDGTMNHPGATYIPLPPAFQPTYILTDANGDRLVWDGLWNPFEDVHSTLVASPGILQLINAGPPGALA